MNSPPTTPPPLDDETIGQLIERAGRPAAAAAADEAMIRSTVHAQWQQVVTQRRRVRHRWMALAATVLLSSTLLLGWKILSSTSHGSIVQIATLAENAPGIVIRRVDAPASSPSAAIALFSGDVLETAAQGVRVQLASGSGLRIAPHSTVRMQEAQLVALTRGALYYEDLGGRAPLEVSTAFGNIEHVGTRYVALLTRTALVVGVRDGAVRVSAGDRRLSIAAREQVAIDSAGHAQRTPLSSAGAAWQWVDALSPALQIEDRRLDDFLTWVAHETGRTLAYSDENTQRAARETILHGSVEHLTPAEALDVVLTTTDFEHIMDGERLVVKHRVR